jgi:hypothetical protein
MATKSNETTNDKQKQQEAVKNFKDNLNNIPQKSSFDKNNIDQNNNLGNFDNQNETSRNAKTSKIGEIHIQ